MGKKEYLDYLDNIQKKLNPEKNIEYFFLSKIKFNLDNLNWQKVKISTKDDEFCRIQETVQFKDLDKNTSFLVESLIKKIVKKKKLYESRVEVCQFQKTSKGGIFDWHIDYQEGRNCICIIYLSDQEDGLVGGTTEFDLQDQIKIITPKNGYCCCFDPKIKHRGSQVIEGIKYSIVILFNNNKVETFYEKNSMGQKKLIFNKTRFL